MTEYGERLTDQCMAMMAQDTEPWSAYQLLQRSAERMGRRLVESDRLPEEDGDE